MAGTPDFAHPPVVELVLGAQFSPLTKLTAGHFGLFWSRLGQDKWVSPQDAPPLEDQFELFDRPRWSRPGELKVRLESAPSPDRFLLADRHDDRLLQIQRTRFLFNWRKRSGSYPSYRRLIEEFEEMYGRFTTFVRESGLGEVQLNQWELTYVDVFPKDEYWQGPDDWSKFLPGLFSNPPKSPGLQLEQGTAEWKYVINPNRGRLHVVAHPGQWREGSRDALRLQMTARGPVGKGGAESLRAGLDLGHEIAVQTFLQFTSEDAQQRWGKQS